MSEVPVQRPLIGVAVVVIRDGRVLLIRRKKPPRCGEWSLPGGRQEWGETVRVTALRELREETGIDARIIGLIDVIDFIQNNPATQSIDYHYTLIDFVSDWLAGDPQPGSDASAAAWFDESAIGDLGLWAETERVIHLGLQRWRAYRRSRAGDAE